MVEIRKENAAQGDRQHDQQLLRDLEIVNARTWSELGPLPPGGLPIAPKRKPALPRPEASVVAGVQPGTASFPVSRAVDDIPTDPEGAEMFILGKLFKKTPPRERWPLRFDRFSFGARCYHTLKCRVVFSNKHQVSEDDQNGPSGSPYAENWKDRWTASHIIEPERVFPPPVDIRWTAMDGVARHVELDLEEVFPDRLILHNAREEDVAPDWGLMIGSRSVHILLEVNDRTINLYMRGSVLLKQRRIPDDPGSDTLRDLILAWTKTY